MSCTLRQPRHLLKSRLIFASRLIAACTFRSIRGLKSPALCAIAFSLVVLSITLSPCRARADSSAGSHTDVVIYGATAAGIFAAIAAREEGASVRLLEPTNHLGGMITSGLSATDTGRTEYIGGLARRFFVEIGRAYGLKRARWNVEPHIAQRTLEQFLESARITVELGKRIEKAEVRERRIKRIELASGETIAATMFIDATYEGDLLARSGSAFTVGRESRSEFDEPSAGVYVTEAHDYIEGEIRADGPDGALLPDISSVPPGQPGSGDQGVPAYTYRLCVTPDPKIRKPFQAPERYQPMRYELMRRYLALHPDRSFTALFNVLDLPGGKFDLNNKGPISSDLIGGSWEYPNASPDRRIEIAADHRNYLEGLLWFLSSDPAVPLTLRRELSTWGLCRDEFVSTGNWPPLLYVREARRMRGAYVMSEKDLRENRKKEDSVGVGSRPIELHHIRRYRLPNGLVQNEGFVYLRNNGSVPYEISYRSLIPGAGGPENLLVPVCLSATHVAFSSLRMEPVLMILGESSGVAAVLALRDGGKSNQISTVVLGQKLIQRAQKLHLETPDHRH